MFGSTMSNQPTQNDNDSKEFWCIFNEIVKLVLTSIQPFK